MLPGSGACAGVPAPAGWTSVPTVGLKLVPFARGTFVWWISAPAGWTQVLTVGLKLDPLHKAEGAGGGEWSLLRSLVLTGEWSLLRHPVRS